MLRELKNGVASLQAESAEPSPKKLKVSNGDAIEGGEVEEPAKGGGGGGDAAGSMDEEGEGISHVTYFERKPEEVGMTEFLGLQRGFSGVVKNRWEDFHVHEIDLDGNVVRLTSVDVPVEDAKEVRALVFIPFTNL